MCAPVSVRVHTCMCVCVCVCDSLEGWCTCTVGGELGTRSVTASTGMGGAN